MLKHLEWNESQEAGRERKNEKEEVQGESLDPQEEQGLSEDLHEDWCQEVAASGYGVSKDVESACSRDGTYGEREIEEADRSSRGQKEYNLAALLHGSFCPGSGGGALHLGHSVLDRMSLDWKMAP